MRAARWARAWVVAGTAVWTVAQASPALARGFLTRADVERVIAQAVGQAERVGLPVAVAVVDKEGAPLGLFHMAGARTTTTLRAGGRAGEGFEGVTLPDRLEVVLGGVPVTLSGAMAAALSKAGTGALFATQGNAFTPRTAGFIIQPHFPPGTRDTPSGPLFGVQFSSLLPCSDVNPVLPLGLSADAGGFPLYLDGQAAGGVGVEGDGRYGVDRDPRRPDPTAEERIAMAASRGFRAPGAIRADRIIVGGLRFPFTDVADERGPRARLPAADLAFTNLALDAPPSGFVPMTVGRVRGEVDPRYFPPRAATEPAPAAGGLEAAEVLDVLGRGARRADRLRAAIRRPLGDRARVTIAVVDRAGVVLGLFRTADAPAFGFDVAVQKARTAAFFSGDAARRLRDRRPDVAAFADAAARDGVRLDGSVAWSARAHGFLSRPLFPDGIDGTAPGPFSRPGGPWSVFNDGLQAELLRPALGCFLRQAAAGPTAPVAGCARRLDEATCAPLDDGLAELANGIQIFPGGVPLYRGRTLVGAVGVSGDGVDQDDAVAYAAGRDFAAPPDLRADRTRVRGVRLPFVKLPRQPTRR